MKEVLTKHSIQSLYVSGYRGDVLLSVMGDLAEIPEGIEIAATLSFSEKVIRTIKQNAAIHLFCGLLAGKFEDAGLDMQTVLEKAVSVTWTMEAVKEVIWKRIQVALFPDKTSTTQLETKDVDKVARVIIRHMATEFNIDQSFPNARGD